MNKFDCEVHLVVFEYYAGLISLALCFWGERVISYPNKSGFPSGIIALLFARSSCDFADHHLSKEQTKHYLERMPQYGSSLLQVIRVSKAFLMSYSLTERVWLIYLTYSYLSEVCFFVLCI